MKRSRQRCHRHSWILQPGRWHSFDGGWHEWKRCRHDGRRLMRLRGVWMPYGGSTHYYSPGTGKTVVTQSTIHSGEVETSPPVR